MVDLLKNTIGYALDYIRGELDELSYYEMR